MRVGMMTTWGSPCGIATYSEQLVPALKGVGIDVVVMAPGDPASKTCIRSDAPDARVELCWDRRVVGSAASSADVVEHYKLDLVHVQHEDGLFHAPKDFVLDLFSSLGCPVCVTLHTVQRNRPGWYRQLLSLDRIHVLVHTPAAWAYLNSFDVGRVSLVRHGTPVTRPGERDRGLALLKQPPHKDVVTGLVFGFVNVGKCIEKTMEMYVQARERGYIKGAARLFVVGSPSSTAAEAYMRSLDGYVLQLGYEHEVFVMSMFVEVADVPHVIAAADLGILNTNSMTYSASGQVHQAAAQGLPLVVANQPIYVEAVQAGCPAFCNSDDDDATRLLAGLYNSVELRSFVSQRMKAFGSATAWDKLAAVYASLYAEMVR